MRVLTLHTLLPPWPLVPRCDPTMVMASDMTPPIGGAQLKTSFTPSNLPMAAGQARTWHSASPDPMGSPTDWV